MKNAFGNSVLILLTLSACGPKLVENKKPAVETPKAPTMESAKISSFASEGFATENIVKRTTTEDQIRRSEFLLDISKIKRTEQWNLKAKQNYLETEKSIPSKKLDYANSTYLDLVFKQIGQDVRSSVKQVDKKITADTDKVIAMIRKEQHTTLILVPESTLLQKIEVTQTFLDTITQNVKKMDIIPEFKESFASELKQQSQKLLNEAKAFDAELAKAETLGAGLKAITDYIEQNSTELNAEDRVSLEQGLNLASVLNSLDDAKSGLQAISLVWQLLNEGQRTEYFKAANEKLYNFLSERSAEDIQCLTEKNCKGLKNTIVLNIGVYPAIEEFGIKNIADLINKKGVLFLLTKVNHGANDSLLKVGETIADQVLTSVNQKRATLDQFKDGLRENLSLGLENYFLSQKIKATNIYVVDSQKIILDFETQATNMRTKLKYLSLMNGDDDKNKKVQLQFEVVEGLTSLPLFSKSPEGESKTIQNDVAEIILNPQPRQYLKSAASKHSEINLNQQSALLLTTAFALNELADWKSTSFDEGITQIKAAQILTQFKSDALNKEFFSKADLISIVLSLSSQTLKLMQSDYSAVILINNQNQLIPIQNLNDVTSGPVVLAAATDFKDGQRAPIVHAGDLSLLLSAMLQFYESTEGIDQTQSEFLLKEREGKPTLLAELMAARESIRLLIIATSNFVSNQLIQPNGLIAKSILLNGNLKAVEEFELVDQTRAIEALVKAYELTKLDVYLWTAQKIYQSMNRILYSDKTNFYQMNMDSEIATGVDSTQLLETYKNLLSLKQYLSDVDQIQFENIFASWLKS